MGGRGRGGRGGGGGGSVAVRAVANALGIARHEMGNYVQALKTEAPPTYPVSLVVTVFAGLGLKTARRETEIVQFLILHCLV